MATFKNPAVLQGKPVPTQANQIAPVREVFDLANPAYRPAAVANGDRIQIGVIPAGCKLIPHLTCIRLPQIDSNGTPTGQAQIGTANDPDALRAAGAVNAAQTLSGEDFTLATADLGAKFEDVPVYLAFTANVATLAASGKIVVDLALRPYDSAVDTDVT